MIGPLLGVRGALVAQRAPRGLRSTSQRQALRHIEAADRGLALFRVFRPVSKRKGRHSARIQDSTLVRFLRHVGPKFLVFNWQAMVLP